MITNGWLYKNKPKPAASQPSAELIVWWSIKIDEKKNWKKHKNDVNGEKKTPTHKLLFHGSHSVSNLTSLKVNQLDSLPSNSIHHWIHLHTDSTRFFHVQCFHLILPSLLDSNYTYCWNNWNAAQAIFKHWNEFAILLYSLIDFSLFFLAFHHPWW